MDITERQQKIVSLLLKKGGVSSSAIHSALVENREDASLVTIKRELSDLAKRGILHMSGSGRSVVYAVTVVGRVFAHIDAREYCTTEPDKRFGLRGYNFDLFELFPDELFDQEEMAMLDNATSVYKNRTKEISSAIQKKELERLVIELSWKSSRIEGNTYTLLDTEKLILEHKEAPGHDHAEAQMILNHKDAFLFIREHAGEFKTLTVANLEQVHAILVQDLNIHIGLREKPVGVLGSAYRPLDNIYQIREGVDALAALITRARTPYAKAMLAIFGISYLQPFEDGNKRTARLMANALLLAHGCAPLSYRSVDENEYREAILVFYEINSVIPFKKIFIDQYIFAAENYAVK